MAYYVVAEHIVAFVKQFRRQLNCQSKSPTPMQTSKTHISRRSFFRSTAVVGGGMLLGFNWLTACRSDKELNQITAPPSDWFEMNAFIKIADNGMVTIQAPNPEIGQNVRTSMPMIVAEELGVSWEMVRVEQAPLDTIRFTHQVAGGSQSIRKGWEGLRKAGATARTMLITAAAMRWGADPATCTTRNGVVYGPNNDALTYAELATEAASLDIPEEVSLKDYEDFTIIGTDVGNVDIDAIITGQPLYGLDFTREGMIYAAILHPPAFGLALDEIDDAETRKVNGVLDVVQFGNTLAVTGTSTWAVFKGKKALRATWKEVAPLESTAEHDTRMRELLDSPSKEPLRLDGDVTKAFQSADIVLERTYEAPFLPHNTMEPMNFFADVREDGVELIGPTQTPAAARRDVAALLGRDESEISVVMTRQGGGFGRRLYNDFTEEAAMISSLTGKPVKLVYSREDDMTAGKYRVASKYKVRAAIQNGSVTGYHLTEASINSHMYGLIPNFFPAGSIPNLRIDAHALPSAITTGAWRAPYTNVLAFAEQTFFDELAEQLGRDPIEWRLELLEEAIPAAEQDERIEYSPSRMQGAIRLVAEKSNWGNAPDGIFQGFSAYYSHNTHVAEVAEVALEGDTPVLKRIICAIDCGIVINPQAARNQCQGGIVDAIGHALYGTFSFSKGRPSAENFDRYRLIRMEDVPQIEIHFVASKEAPTGLGEPPFPPAAPAFANALYKATRQRYYALPFTPAAAERPAF